MKGSGQRRWLWLAAGGALVLFACVLLVGGVLAGRLLFGAPADSAASVPQSVESETAVPDSPVEADADPGTVGESDEPSQSDEPPSSDEPSRSDEPPNSDEPSQGDEPPSSDEPSQVDEPRQEADDLAFPLVLIASDEILEFLDASWKVSNSVGDAVYEETKTRAEAENTVYRDMPGARWTFFEDGTFTIQPRAGADVRTDFYPPDTGLVGEYEIRGGRLVFEAVADGDPGSEFMVSGSIDLSSLVAEISKETSFILASTVGGPQGQSHYTFVRFRQQMRKAAASELEASPRAGTSEDVDGDTGSGEGQCALFDVRLTPVTDPGSSYPATMALYPGTIGDRNQPNDENPMELWIYGVDLLFMTNSYFLGGFAREYDTDLVHFRSADDATWRISPDPGNYGLGFNIFGFQRASSNLYANLSSPNNPYLIADGFIEVRGREEDGVPMVEGEIDLVGARQLETDQVRYHITFEGQLARTELLQGDDCLISFD